MPFCGSIPSGPLVWSGGIGHTAGALSAQVTWHEKLQTAGEDKEPDEFPIITSFPWQPQLFPWWPLTFTRTALSDESHHQRRALATFSGCSEGLHNKLMRLWLQKESRCYEANSLHSMDMKTVKRLISIEEIKEWLMYFRSVAFWAAVCRWSLCFWLRSIHLLRKQSQQCWTSKQKPSFYICSRLTIFFLHEDISSLIQNLHRKPFEASSTLCKVCSKII